MRRREGHPIVAATLDVVMRPLDRVRAEIVPDARGRVLEIGVGTGLNLPHYREIASLDGIEPDPHMQKRARARAERLGVSLRLVAATAESLPYPNENFDTVVCTFTLCTVDDPERALLEMRRVLRPGGMLLFAEHTRSRFFIAARLQEGLTPIWTHLSGGCHLDRDSVRAIREAGFSLAKERAFGRERFTLAPVYAGVAAR